MLSIVDVRAAAWVATFFSPFALTLILQQVQIVGIVAAAQTLVILTAGIDLCVGAITVLSSVIMGQFTFRYGLPVELAIVFGLAVRHAHAATINGWLVAVMKLPPFIVTLGMWQIVLAANFLYSANETIRSQDIEAERTACCSSLARLSSQMRRRRCFTFGVIFMIASGCWCWPMCCSHTAWGRHVYAVGDDPEAANCPASTCTRR